MVNLKNCLTAGVIFYGAVFALYGNRKVDTWGVHPEEAGYDASTIERGSSAGYSAGETTYMTDPSVHSVAFHKKGGIRAEFTGGRGGVGGQL